MKRRFISKNRVNVTMFKLIFLLVIFALSFYAVFNFLYLKIDINFNNEEYIDYLLNDSFGKYNIGDIKNKNSIDFLFKYSLGYEKPKKNLVIETPIKIDKKKISKKPLVYIYNTHQSENYSSVLAESFNINNTVLVSSYVLKEYLYDLGIEAIVEENKVSEILNLNNWKYAYSYKASRILLEDAKKTNPSLQYFIDIHRDSVSYNISTFTIEEKSYAKILFVVGLEHNNYQDNLVLAEKLNEKLSKFNPGITRGIMKKSGVGVNGIYNQDFSKNSILIEVGGQYNNIEEVNNTLKVLANVLYEYIREMEYE